MRAEIPSSFRPASLGKLIAFVVAACLLSAGPSALAQRFEWSTQFGTLGPAPDSATAIDVDGNVYVTGWTDGAFPAQTNSGGADAFVRKYSIDGGELWTQEFGSSGGDTPNAITVEAAALYVVGKTTGTLPGQTSAGGADAFVRKYDLDGIEQWTRQFGYPGDDSATVVAADATGVYVAGTVAGASPFQTHAFVRKYDTEGNELWSRQFGSAGSDVVAAMVVETTALYLAGETTGVLGSASAGGRDAFVQRYDLDGTLQWTRQFGTSGSDSAKCIAADATGVYVGGRTSGMLPGQTNAGGAFLRKYDPDGVASWTRQFGSSFDFPTGLATDGMALYLVGSFPSRQGSVYYVRSFGLDGTVGWLRVLSFHVVAVATDGLGVYVAGGDSDAFVARYDTGGNEIWTRQFGALQPAPNSIAGVHVRGNIVYVAGATFGALPGQTVAAGQNAFVRSYDVSGTELWTNQFGDSAHAVVADATGFYVAGQALAQGTAIRVRKYELDGSLAWTRQFGSVGQNSDGDQAKALAADGTGLYVVGVVEGLGGPIPGQTRAGAYDAFVRKYDAAGVELWTHQFGSSFNDSANGVAADASGVYVVGSAGGALPGQTYGGGFFTDAFVRKYDQDGNELWTRQFGTSTNDTAQAVAIDATGLYVAGDTTGVLPGQATAGGLDAFVRKYDLDGNELWTRQFGSSSNDSAGAIAANSTGVFVAGYTQGTLPGQTSAGGTDAFVRKYDADGNEIWTRQFGTSSSDFANGVSVGPAGLFVAGSLGPNAFLAKINSVCTNVVLQLDAAGQATLSAADVYVDLDGAPVTLNLSGRTSYSCADNGTAHWVTLTVTDEEGAMVSCTAKVTVVDTLPPVPNAASLPEVVGLCAAELSQPPPTATDNCGGIVTGSPSGNFFSESGTVTWTFVDASGNATTQPQSIVVKKFSAAPFEAPMGGDKKGGAALPVKTELYTPEGLEILGEAALTQYQLANNRPAACPAIRVYRDLDGELQPLEVRDNVGDVPSGDCFRYSSPDWIYNLSLDQPMFSSGLYSVGIQIGACLISPENGQFEVR
jgi:hypothetical protein